MKSKLFLALALSLVSSMAVAADKAPTKPDVSSKIPPLTKEQRESMAKVHEKMATCLRTDKSMRECGTEMMETCKTTMGGGGCPMMSGQMMGYGQMMGHGSMMGAGQMMNQPQQPEEKTQDKK